MKVGVQYSVHYGRPRKGSLTQQHAYCLRKAHFQHFETRLSQKKTAMKNSNNVSLRSTSFNHVSAEPLR